MKAKVIEYDESKHELICDLGGMRTERVDPFVGCCVETDNENYKEVGHSLVGKTFEFDTDHFFCGTFIPSFFVESKDR